MNGVCVRERERDENEMQRDRAPRYRALQLLERIHWPGIGRFGIGPWRCFACARLLLFLLFHSEKKWNFRPTGKHLDTPGAGQFTKYSCVLFLAHQRVITDRNEFRYLFLNSPFNFCNFFSIKSNQLFITWPDYRLKFKSPLKFSVNDFPFSNEWILGVFFWGTNFRAHETSVNRLGTFFRIFPPLESQGRAALPGRRSLPLGPRLSSERIHSVWLALTDVTMWHYLFSSVARSV